MVKLSAGLVILLIILSIPFMSMATQYGLYTMIFALAVFSVGLCATFFAVHLIFKGLEDLKKKK